VFTVSDETTVTIADEPKDYQLLHKIKYDLNGTSVLFMSALARSAIFYLSSSDKVSSPGVRITVDVLKTGENKKRGFQIDVCHEECKLVLSQVIFEGNSYYFINISCFTGQL